MRTRLTKIASLTARLDAVADEIQKHDPKMALAIDRVSDRIEGRTASMDFKDFREKLNKIFIKHGFKPEGKVSLGLGDSIRVFHKESEHEYEVRIWRGTFGNTYDFSMEDVNTKKDVIDIEEFGGRPLDLIISKLDNELKTFDPYNSGLIRRRNNGNTSH